MKRKLKRITSFILAVTLCVTININPIAFLINEFIHSEFVKTLGVVGDNIVYVLSNSDVPTVLADEDGEDSGPIDVEVVNTPTVSVQEANAITEAIYNAAQNTTNNHTNTQAVISAESSNICAQIIKYGTLINNSINDCTDRMIKQSIENTDRIVETIKAAQHEYKVCYLYSINNQNDQVLWRPTLEELPGADILPYITVGYSNVYSGFWDTGIDNTTNNRINQGAFGIKDIIQANNDSTRALEILGYDAVIRYEGYYGAAASNTGNYVRTTIPDGDVTWGDAVQVIYKALGQYQYSYSYFTTPANITPETSPLSQGLSNITTFDTSEGMYYLWVSRSDRLVSSSLTQIERPYWDKAQADGFVLKDNYSKNISWTDFITLCKQMMYAYGEPVITDEEINSLLQVYGAEYPIQLGKDLADAWAYLKARGIISFENIDWAGSVTRDQLLDVCMRIKDEGSRLDYKKVQLVMNIDDVMKADGYYPAKNTKFATDSFTVTETIDYKKMKDYDYFVLMSSQEFGTYRDDKGTHNITPSFVTEEGKTTTALKVVDRSGTAIPDSKVYGTITDPDGNVYYHFKVPKDFKGEVRLTSNNDTDYPKYISIPSSLAGGGVYHGFSVDTNNALALSCAASGYELFGEINANRGFWSECTDYKRSGNSQPIALAPNPSIREYLAYQWDKWTTPMEVKAATYSVSDDGKVFTLTVNPDTDNKNQMDTSGKNVTGTEKETSFYSNSPMRFCNSLAAVCKSDSWKNLINSCGSQSDFEGKVKLMFQAIKEPGKKHMLDSMTNAAFESGPAYNSAMQNGKYFATIFSGDFTDMNIDNATSMFNGRESSQMFTYGNYNSAGKYVWFDSPTSLYNCTTSQMGSLYNAIKNAGVSSVDIDLDFTANTSGGTVKSVTYRITATDMDKLSECIGEIASLTVEGGQQTASAQNTATSQQISLDQTMASSHPDILAQSVANSVIMNRSLTENILVPWRSLVECGIVVDTFGGMTPTPKEDGIYYLQSKQGMIKINPITYSVLVGTTYYNFRNKQSVGPKLVYISEDSELFIDYRCIMGLVTFQDYLYDDGANATQIVKSDNCIGAGTSAIYTLNESGANTSSVKTADFNMYNWPNLPSSSSGLSVDSFTVKGITETFMDTLDDGNGFYYWNDDAVRGASVRVPLSTFYPTANWLTAVRFIGDEKSGRDVQAGLFVWFPRIAFASGAYDSVAPTNGVDAFDDKNSDAYPELNALIEEMVDKEGMEFKPDVNWYDAMTFDALVKMYAITGGITFVNKNFSVRYFDITNNAPDRAPNSYVEKIPGGDTLSAGMNANVPGAIYWLESVGFVYNAPIIDNFDFNSYVAGIYPIPLVFAKSSSVDGLNNDAFLNINPDYYGKIKQVPGNAATVSGYGYAVGTLGCYDANSLNNGKGGLIGDWYNAITHGGMPTSYKEDLVDITNMTYAPSGMYAFVGGGSVPYITEKQLTQQVLNANNVYLGTQRLYYAVNPNGTTDKLYHRANNMTEPITLTSVNPSFYLVYQGYGDGRDCYINLGTDIRFTTLKDTYESGVDEWDNTDVFDLLEALNLTHLLNTLDEAATWIILFVFYVCPIIGWILTTLYLGCSFCGGNKIAVGIANRIIDPVKILSLGYKDMETVRFKQTIIPVFILYISEALILNGNIIKLTAWCSEFILTLKEISLQVF